MITQQINALFQFIEYLHSNIDNFNRYNNLIAELEDLANERKKLNPQDSYKDKKRYDEVQAEIEAKFKTLQENTADLIICRAKELNVCNFDSKRNYDLNEIEDEIQQLKSNFSNDDLPEILKFKNQYIEYRKQTHKTFLSLGFFFDDFDDVMKSLFNYFDETANSEFEAFETKPVQSQPDDSAPEAPHQQIESLSDIITHDRSTEIVKGIKIQYKNIKGKRLKILLIAMQDLRLLPIERIAKKFHTLCKKEFDWDIASYNAMNDYSFNEKTDNPEKEDMISYLKEIIN